MGSVTDDIGAWVGIGVGICLIVASFYGFVRWGRKQLRDAIVDDVKPIIDNLHSCLDAQAKTMTDHMESNQASFANINARMDRDHDAATEDRAELMLMLRNIQQGTQPPTGRD